MSLGLGDLFDGLVIAWQKDILLLSVDLPIRQVAAEMGFRKTAWTLGVLFTTRDRSRLDTVSPRQTRSRCWGAWLPRFKPEPPPADAAAAQAAYGK
nr:hypothetical protein [uncultured Rhodopila sp.]